MTVREGGRYLADKKGELTRDPKDKPTAPIPVPGEAGYAESAATPNAPAEEAASGEGDKPTANAKTQEG